MALRNTSNSYGSLTKFFHWGIAVAIYSMLAIGYLQGYVTNPALEGQVYNFHKLFGLTILLAMVLRLSWRFTNPTPRLPENTPTWQKFGARFTHLLLYVALFTMPISGWIMSTAAGHAPSLFGWKIAMPSIPHDKPLGHQAHDIHKYVAIALITIIVIHVLAALKHHFFDRDDVLKRMLPTKN